MPKSMLARREPGAIRHDILCAMSASSPLIPGCVQVNERLGINLTLEPTR